MSAIFFGLASAACWGAGDFSGGVATKRSSVYSVVIFAQLVGVTLLAILALLLGESIPPRADLLIGGAAGLAGAVGLVSLYQGLAAGRMGIVAPLAAVVSATVPVIFGLFVEGLPAPQRFLGFGTALVAVWMLSRPEEGSRIRWRDLGLPLLAGLGFGVFLIFIDQVSETSVLWPLVAARIVSLGLLLFIATLLRPGQLSNVAQWPVIVLAGLFDSGGNAFFALSARIGRLDVAAVLSSLYPAGTVLLAWLLLQERITRRQGFGVVAALVAVLLIAA